MMTTIQKNAFNIAATALLFLGISNMVFAQHGPHGPKGHQTDKVDRDKVEAMKIGFFTKELNLSSSEAQKFWPIYNEREAALKVLREARRKAHKDLKDKWDSMSDSQVDKFMNEEFASRQKEFDLIKKYHTKFKEVLPVKKVAKLYKAERDFKMKMLKAHSQRGNKSQYQKREGHRAPHN